MVKINHLERNDWIALALALLVSLVAFAAVQFSISIPGLQSLALLILPAGLVSLILIALTVRLWGGEVRRYLTIIGFGIAIFLIETFPHVQWHRGQMGPYLGIGENFWYIFFHGGIAVAFAMIAYGFYLFYHSADEPV